MDAVLELVWTGSYGATTIDMICVKAGVKKGSFYYFFDSKTDLTATALEACWENIYRPQLDAIYSAAVDPLQRLKAAAEHAYEEQRVKHEQIGQVLGCPLFTLGNEISTRESKLRDVIERILTTQRRYVESALREAVARGDIQCADPSFMAKALFLYWEGALAEARIKNDLTLLKDLWPSIQQLLGIKPASSKRSRQRVA